MHLRIDLAMQDGFGTLDSQRRHLVAQLLARLDSLLIGFSPERYAEVLQ